MFTVTWRNLSLATKLTLIITILVVMSVSAITWLSIRREQETFRQQLEQQAQLSIDILSAASINHLYFLNVDELSNLALRLNQDSNIVLTRFYGSQGQIVVDVQNPALARKLENSLFDKQILAAGGRLVFDWHTDQLLAGQTLVIGKQQIGAVGVGLSTAPLQAKIAAARNQGLAVALVTIAVGIGLAFWVSQSVTNPLQELVQATRRIAGGDLTQQIAIGGTDEVALLSQAMDHMRLELQELYLGLEQKIAERTAELQKSEEKFRQVVTSISDHIYMWELTKDGSYKNHYISPNVKALTGYSAEMFMADWNFWPQQVIHPDDRVAAAAQIKRLGEGHKSELEYRLIKAAGDTIWVRDSGQVQKDNNNQSTFIFGVVSDITERKQALQAAEQQRTFLQQVIDINPHFIFAKDRQGRFTLVNRAFAQAYSTTIANIIGKTDADFNPNLEMVKRYNHHHTTVIESGEELIISNDEVVNIHGQKLWRYTVKRPIKDETGQVQQVLGVATDITYLKQAEEAIANARDQALKANEFKTRLLSNVSHDLRTPLGTILGYTEMLYEGIYDPLSPKQQELTRKIIFSIHELTEMINHLLDQAKLESDTIALINDTFEPKVLTERMRTTMEYLAEKKGLRLLCEIAPDLPTSILGDVDRLHQIVNNLVGNAIKFTEKGVVRVRLYRLAMDHWAIEVSDTGPGIPIDAQSYIFDPFRQVDSSTTRKHGGAGLGLSIVKQLAILMGGQVWLESKPGQGSTFTILLPLMSAQENNS